MLNGISLENSQLIKSVIPAEEKRMKAIVLHQKMDLRYEDVPDATIKDHK